MVNSEIRPLEIVTSSVSRWLASPHSPRGDFKTGEEWPTEIRRAADDLFDVDGTARRAVVLLGVAANARWR